MMLKNFYKKSIVVIAILSVFSVVIFCQYFINNKKENFKFCKENKKTNQQIEKDDPSDIENILLLGVDNQENASDTIMILSLNNKVKSLKLISIMRDSYIYYGPDKVNKINYAYHYGGIKNSVEIINKNYRLDIKNYLKVNFNDVEEIINFIDGINVDVKPNEIYYVNLGIKSQCKGKKCSPVTKSGIQLLNGTQALAYARIRKIDSDFVRTERQRIVIKAIFNKIKSISKEKYPGLILKAKNCLDTNFSTLQLLSLSNKLINFDSIGELRLPVDGTCNDYFQNKIYYLKWDRNKNIKKLQNFIYKN